jgi:hypothetical protein
MPSGSRQTSLASLFNQNIHFINDTIFTSVRQATHRRIAMTKAKAKRPRPRWPTARPLRKRQRCLRYGVGPRAARASGLPRLNGRRYRCRLLPRPPVSSFESIRRSGPTATVRPSHAVPRQRLRKPRRDRQGWRIALPSVLRHADNRTDR